MLVINWLKNFKSIKKQITPSSWHYQRGGVPIADTLAHALDLPFDLMLVRKLGHPYQPEFAFGAIAVGGVMVINPPYKDEDILKEPLFAKIVADEKRELERRNQYYRNGKKWPELSNKTVILVDDGIATGATMKAAIEAVKQLGCKHLVVAVPVMPADEYDKFVNLVEELYVCYTPTNFSAVGVWYQYFDQVSDDEVISLLSQRKNGNDMSIEEQ